MNPMDAVALVFVGALIAWIIFVEFVLSKPRREKK